MKKIEFKSRKLLRSLFACFSFTAIAFVFQACYGVDPPHYYDVKFTGSVKSKTTNLPIRGIKIQINDGKICNHDNNYGFTDANGQFNFYASVPSGDYYFQKDSIVNIFSPDSLRVHFLDIDGIENGEFVDKTIIINPAYKKEVKMFVELEEKN
jgi:hypothetical protein